MWRHVAFGADGRADRSQSTLVGEEEEGATQAKRVLLNRAVPSTSHYSGPAPLSQRQL